MTGLEFLGLLQVLPCTECSITRAGHDDGLHRGTAIPALEHRGDFRAHRRVPCVELPGFVECDCADAARDVGQDRVAHEAAPWLNRHIEGCGPWLSNAPLNGVS